MERMLVTVFANEMKANDGFQALQALEKDGAVNVYASRVVIKDANGSIVVRSTEGLLPEVTLVGMVVGSLIGLLGGPVWFAVGSTTGLALGAATDFTRARAGRDVVASVSKTLPPGQAALIAEIDEEFVGAADARLEAAGGSVSNRDLLAVENSEYDRDMHAISDAVSRVDARRAARRVDQKVRFRSLLDAIAGRIRRVLDRS